jgi:copper(I)-binding protein
MTLVRSYTRRRALALAVGLGVVSLMPAAWPTPALAHEIKAGDLLIVHPWSRQTPANAKVAAGFLKIVNNGTTEDRLLSATAEIADSVQLHEMKMVGDVMEMAEVAGGIPIPPGATVELKPKSLHIMFIGLKSAPMPGSVFKGTLTFEKAGTVNVDFEVQEMGKDEPAHGASH